MRQPIVNCEQPKTNDFPPNILSRDHIAVIDELVRIHVRAHANTRPASTAYECTRDNHITADIYAERLSDGWTVAHQWGDGLKLCVMWQRPIPPHRMILDSNTTLASAIESGECTSEELAALAEYEMHHRPINF